MKPGADRLQVGRVDVDVPGGGRIDPLQHGAVGLLHAEADVRADHGSAVGDRRVGDRELERRHLYVALPDREVDVVADGPGAVGAVSDPTPARSVLRLALEGPGGVVAFALEVVHVVPPGGRGQVPANFAAEVDAGGTADPERVRPLLKRAAIRVGRGLGIGERAEVVEEHVVGHPDRVLQIEHAVGAAARVVAALPVEAELACVVVAVSHGPRPALQRRGSRDRLERGAGRACALDRAVDQRVAARGVVELRVHRRGHRLSEDVGVERGVGPHRVDLAVVRVHRHERAAVGRGIRGDRLPQRGLAGLLERNVQRQLEIVPGHRLDLAQRAREPPERVHLDPVGAVGPLQVVVVVPLEPRLPDDRGLRQAVEPPLLELRRGDRPDRAE